MISGWRIKQNQVSTTGLVDTKKQPGATKLRQDSEAVKRQMVAETRAPGASELETSSRHLPPQLTPLAPAWNSRTAVIENHADNRYWERQNGVENRAVSA